MSVDSAIGLKVFYAFVTSVGCVLNVGLFILLQHFQLSSKLTLILLRIQAIADAISCLFSTLMCVLKSRQTGDTVTDLITCHLWDSQLFYWISVVLSTSNLIWITVDRLWATVYAATYKLNFHRYLVVSSVITFIYTASLAIPVSLLVQYRNGSCIAMSLVTTEDAFYSNYVHPYVWLIFYYFLPSLVMLGVHFRIIFFMRRLIRKSNTIIPAVQQQEQRIMRSFTICTYGFAVSLFAAHAYGTFYYVVETTNTLFYEPGSPNQLLSVFLTTLNSCINPVILILTLPSLRQKSKELFCSCWRRSTKKPEAGE
ncbi:unnamed protein product [Echinostoma caproni]|uniref:G_PROTEIN_RECEP_F1_2 domain-containing protein n=1 Tax=Echinostoma caproni TaxID=27848 RepID=A0A183AE32_9TREM|nr:unnamed protein product [Echinostoma caproni]